MITRQHLGNVAMRQDAYSSCHQYKAVGLLARFDKGRASVAEALDAVLACDAQLKRTSQIQSMNNR